MKFKHAYHKLWQLYVSSMLLPLLILASTLTIIVTKRVIDDTMIKNMNALNTLSYNIETLLDEMKQCSIQWVNVSDIVQFYKRVNNNSGIIPLHPTNLEKKYIVSIGNILANSNSHINYISFYPISNPDCHIYVSSRYQLIDYANYMPDSDWFLDVANDWGTPRLCVPTQESYSSNGQKYFSLLRLSFDVDKHAPYGIVKVDASTEYFDSLFANLELRDNSGIIIYDKDGNFIFSTDDSLINSARITDGKINSGNNKYIIQNKQIGDYSWNISYFTSKIDLLFEAKIIIIIAVAIGIFTLIVSFYLFSRKSRGLTEPLQRVLSAMHLSESGDLNSRIAITDDMPIEFRSISIEYNTLLDTLNKYIESEYKAKLDYQKAEYKALQSQINPHFLYNTLNNFVTLNRLGYHQKLEDSIMALTEMFRYSSSKSPESTIANEFSFVEKYLSLQKIRYRERLEYKISMDPETEDLLIPRLLIQPIVENSVIHGIEPIERTVHISISSAIITSDSILRIVIEDDGAGSMDLLGHSKGNHTALENIQERLKIFAQEATFSFNMKANQGGITVITIPLDNLQHSNKDATMS